MNSEFTFSAFFQLIRDKWRTFLWVILIAAVLSAVLSGPQFIAPKYRSTAICYPVNLQSYSVETRTDQLLQLFGSNSIRDSLIENFNLSEHYDVDTSGTGGYFLLYNEFNDRVLVSKTRFESVLIEVEDEDPKVARDMVVEMLDQVNLLARWLQRSKSEELLQIAEDALAHESHKLDSIERRINSLSKDHGLLTYETQAEELIKGYVKSLSSARSSGQRKEIQRMLTELQERGGEFRYLTGLSELFRDNYDALLTEYEKKVSDVTKELTYTNVVVYPEVSDKKVYPIRWLIVLLSTISALFLAFVILVMRRPRNTN